MGVGRPFASLIFLAVWRIAFASELPQPRWDHIGNLPELAASDGVRLLMASARVGWLLDAKTGLWATNHGGTRWTKVAVPGDCFNGSPLEARISNRGSGVIRCRDSVCWTPDWGRSWECRSLPLAGAELSVCCVLQTGTDRANRVYLGGALYELPQRPGLDDAPGRLGVIEQTGRFLVAIPVLYAVRSPGSWSSPVRISKQPDRLIHLEGDRSDHLIGVTEEGVFASNDGAETWFPSEFLDGCLGGQGLPDCDTIVTAVGIARGTGSAWLALRSGVLYRSTNHGRQWRVVFKREGDSRVVGSHFEELHFTSPKFGWALAMDGQLLRTADGGVSWSPVITPGQVQSLSVPGSKGVLIVVGNRLYSLR